MKVDNDDGITAEVALALRRALKLPQSKFWAAVGVNQASGCRYEKDKTERIPRPVRKLLFLAYVVGLDVDTSSEEGIARLFKLAQAGKPARIGEYPAVPYQPM